MKAKAGLQLLKYLLCVLIAIVFLYPLYYTFINSLRPLVSTPAIFVPKGWEFVNYYYAVTLIPFFKYLFNSCCLVAITCGIGLITNFLYAYALSRYKVKGHMLVYYLVLSQLMIPALSIMIPQYILFSLLGLKNTYWIWVLNAVAGTPATIFLYRQYLQNIPCAIEEAASIDGASTLSLIFRVVFPICKAIIAVGMFSNFLFVWGDYLTPYMYLSTEKYPLAMALFGVSYSFPNNPNFKLIPVQLAASLLFAIPVLIVFFICQKQLVQGTATAGIKG